jgi:uncharacterized protein with NRDE domain
MCLIVFDWRPDAHKPGDALLTLVANRDEFFVRHTASLGAWVDAPHIVAGRDLAGGGTWLGVTRDGRFAALTNYRAPGQTPAHAPSRGVLVSGYLLAGDAANADRGGALRERLTPLAYLDHIMASVADYNGFNLLLGDFTRRELVWFSNRSAAPPMLLSAGVYGLSNALLDTPWPKVERKKAALGAALARHPAKPAEPRARLEPLIELLRDPALAPDDALPSTGIPFERERALSAAFIETPDYGTRSTTALTVELDAAGLSTVWIAERSDDDGPHRVARPGDTWRAASFPIAAPPPPNAA